MIRTKVVCSALLWARPPGTVSSPLMAQIFRPFPMEKRTTEDRHREGWFTRPGQSG